MLRMNQIDKPVLNSLNEPPPVSCWLTARFLLRLIRICHWFEGIGSKILPEEHCLASRGFPNDARLWSRGADFSISLSHQWQMLFLTNPSVWDREIPVFFLLLLFFVSGKIDPISVTLLYTKQLIGDVVIHETAHTPRLRHSVPNHRMLGMWELNWSLIFSDDRKMQNLRVNRSASLVSHWNVGPSGWDFPALT